MREKFHLSPKRETFEHSVGMVNALEIKVKRKVPLLNRHSTKYRYRGQIDTDSSPEIIDKIESIE